MSGLSSKPDITAQRNFLRQAYFGLNPDFYSRAYRDMNRTLRGIRARSDAKNIFEAAKQCLKQDFDQLAKRSFAATETHKLTDEFDCWHRATSDRLKNYYNKLPEPFFFSYGQAQKWINMAFKYLWYFADEDPEGLDRWFSAAHIPVDEIVLKRIIETKIVDSRPCVTWSSWDNWDDYLEFQNVVRKYAAGQQKIPLAIEAELFMAVRS